MSMIRLSLVYDLLRSKGNPLQLSSMLQVSISNFISTVIPRTDKEKSGLQADNDDLMNQIETLKKQKVVMSFARHSYVSC